MNTFSQKIKSAKKSMRHFLNSIAWQEHENPIHSAKSLSLEELGLYPINQYFQYDSYDEETDIYHCKNAKGIIIEAEPMSGASDNHMEAMYTLLQRTLPEGAILHCLLYASPHLGEAFDAYVSARKGHHPVTEKLAEKRAAFWKRSVFHSLVPWQPTVLRDYKLLLCLVFDHELELSDAKIFTLKEQLKGVLKSINVQGQFLKPEQFIPWVESLLRPSDALYLKAPYYNGLTPLSTLLAAPHRQKRVLSDHILIDDSEWQIRNFRIEDFGKQSPHLSQMSDLIGHLFEHNAQIGCPFSLSFIVKICKASEENGHASRLAFRALQRAEVIGKFSPKAIRDAQDARAIVSEIEKSERLVLVSFQISLYCKTTEAAEQESNLINVFQSADFKWKVLKNTMLQPVMLLAHLPLAQNFTWLQDLQKLGLLYKVWARNAAGMLPMIAEPKGMNTPNLMIAGRRGQVFFFDPFGNQRGNYNTCVAGIAGSGKSVVVQEMAKALIGTGGRVFIIDIGRSYKKLCGRLSGQFIEFTAHSQLCLNPFSTVNADELIEFTDFMVNFIAVMINPQQGLSLIERAFVEKAVKKAWEAKGVNGSITDVSECLLANDDQRAQDLGIALYPYTTQGQYGHFFNGKATVNFDNPFVVFELEEISGNKLLQSIVFMLLMYHVTEKMYLGTRETKITLIIDEAWTMLKGGQGGAIIENIARKARKYKGALITITQSVMDYFLSEASQAAFTNSYWKIILMQNKGDIETLVEQRKLPLNPFQKRLLCSLKTEHGAYSEMMILGDGGECTVGRLFLDPYSRVLYSTQAADFAVINELCQQGVALEEAIEIVAKRNFPNET
jgi:conjugal transfer ATP-binding protein TraC